MRRPPQPLRAAIRGLGMSNSAVVPPASVSLFFRKRDGQEYIGYCDVSDSPWSKASFFLHALIFGITIEARCMIACVGEATRRPTSPLSNSPCAVTGRVFAAYHTRSPARHGTYLNSRINHCYGRPLQSVAGWLDQYIIWLSDRAQTISHVHAPGFNREIPF